MLAAQQNRETLGGAHQRSVTMQPKQADRNSWLRLRLDELDEVEKKMEIVRPRNRVRKNLLVLFLLAVAIGAGVAVSIDASVWSTSAFGLATVSALATWVAVISPRHRLKALKWQRDQLLDQIGEASTNDTT